MCGRLIRRRDCFVYVVSPKSMLYLENLQRHLYTTFLQYLLQFDRRRNLVFKNESTPGCGILHTEEDLNVPHSRARLHI